MTNIKLDVYAISILDHHNDRRRALDLIQRQAITMLDSYGFYIPADALGAQLLASLATIIAINPIKPLTADELAISAMLARNVDA